MLEVFAFLLSAKCQVYHRPNSRPNFPCYFCEVNWQSLHERQSLSLMRREFRDFCGRDSGHVSHVSHVSHVKDNQTTDTRTRGQITFHPVCVPASWKQLEKLEKMSKIFERLKFKQIYNKTTYFGWKLRVFSLLVNFGARFWGTGVPLLKYFIQAVWNLEKTTLATRSYNEDSFLYS